MIYNFVVDDFFIWNHLQSQNFIWSAQILKFNFFRIVQMTLDEKNNQN
jgi:hypothetical protein